MPVQDRVLSRFRAHVLRSPSRACRACGAHGDPRRVSRVRPASGQPATLTFGAFHTEDLDDVEIYDRDAGAALARAHGATPPPTMASVLVVRFSTTRYASAPGWQGSR